MSKYSTYKTPNLLKDNSWIKKLDDEDEDIDRDPNFGKTVLSQVKTDEDDVGSEREEIKTTTTTRTSTSVQALSKRFGGSQDDLNTSGTLPTSKTTSSYTKSTYSSLKSDSPSSKTTTSKTTVTELPKTSTRTSSVSKDGKTTETTTTTTQSLRSPVIKSPTMTEAFTERVRSSSKDPQYAGYSPTRTKVTETTVTSKNDAEDNLFDTLIPSSVKNDYSPTDSKTTVSTTETVTVKSSTDTDADDKLFETLVPSKIKNDFSPTDSKTTVSSTEYVTVRSSSDVNDTKTTTTTTRTSSMAEDDLYGTLLPRSITSTSGLSSPVSSSITRKSYTVESSRGGESPTLSPPSSIRRSTSSYDDLPSSRTSSYTVSTTPSYEYSSINSPTSYSTKSYRSSSRSDDMMINPTYSSSVKSAYASSERAVLEKDLCNYCHKPFTGDAKMVLDDMKINCHASCFKCEVCNSSLSHMKAGDSMWIYKRMVHCENCFEVTRDKWRR